MRALRRVAFITAVLLTVATPELAAADPPGPLSIYSSLPLQGISADQTAAIVNGERLALAQVADQAGGFAINYVSLDDSTVAAGRADLTQTAANARRAAADPSAIAYLGEYNSTASKVSMPILNRAGIAQISPSNTYIGLTRGGPGSLPGEPGIYSPTGRRTYARVAANDIAQGAALATLMHLRHCHRVYALNSNTVYAIGVANALRRAAPRNHLALIANRAVRPRRGGYRSLAAGIGRRRADCVEFSGEIENDGVRLFRDLGTVLPRAQLFGSDGVVLNDFANPRTGLPSRIARRFYGTIATLDPSAFPPAGLQFFTDYTNTYGTTVPDPYAIYGYESMKLVLDTIAAAGAAGGDRQTIINGVFATRNRQSALGTYSIDQYGDTTLRDYGAYLIRRGQFYFYRTIHAR